MKKIFMLTLMVLFVVSVTIVPCSAEDIYGCYQKNNGQLRIVHSANECRPSETFIKWNEAGPQGPPGTSNLPSCSDGQILMYEGASGWTCKFMCFGEVILNPESDNFNCGSCGHICSFRQQCTNGFCGGCMPTSSCTSQNATCGSIPDGCGGSFDCGTCRVGNCVDNKCVISYAGLIGSPCTTDEECIGADGLCISDPQSGGSFCTRFCIYNVGLCNSAAVNPSGPYGGFYSCWSLGENEASLCWPNGSGAECSLDEPCQRPGEACINGLCFYPGTAFGGARNTARCNNDSDCLTGEKCFQWGGDYWGSGFTGWCLWNP